MYLVSEVICHHWQNQDSVSVLTMDKWIEYVPVPSSQKKPPAINVNFYPSPAHSTQRRYPEINLCPTEAREGKKSEVVTDKSRA